MQNRKPVKRKKKMEELRKALEEERQIAELRKMQADAGLIPQSNLNRLDWMYSGPQAGPSAEEYLLGKEYTADKKESFEQVNKLKETPGSLFIKEKDGASEKLEAENRLREDPMMDFLRAEQGQRHQILKNPVKMQSIRKAALIQKLKKATKKMKKSQKKKKDKKDKKV